MERSRARWKDHVHKNIRNMGLEDEDARYRQVAVGYYGRVTLRK